MSFIDKLERAFGRFAIPGISLYFVIAQVFVTLAAMVGNLNPAILIYVPQAVLLGQWWRIVTFLFVPSYVGSGLLSIVFLVFGWWLFYFMGSALEGYWGSFRYNLFLLTGYLLTVGLAFITPENRVTYDYLACSVFLAFAYLNPDFEILILMIVPVKVRWLSLLVWIYYSWIFIRGDLAVRLQILSPVVTILLFFGKDIWLTAGLRSRQIRGGAARTVRRVAPANARHRCRICGKTDQTNPEMDFRYCSKCAGEACYCSEHIFNHEHIQPGHEGAESP